MSAFFKHNNFLLILLSGCIVILLMGSGAFLGILNKTLQNQYYTLKNTLLQNTVNPHILVVEIDDISFETIGSFPFKRSIYAQALENIQKYTPAVVAFDVLFLDPSEENEDRTFEQSLSKYDNIVLGVSVDTETQKVYPPIFGNHAEGFLFPNIDSSNKTVYSFSPLFRAENGELYEHFALQVLRKFYTAFYQKEDFDTLGTLLPSHYVFTPKISFPLASRNSEEILINFTPASQFTRISFSDLLDIQKLQQLNEKIELQDTIFLIGPAAEGLKDDFFTPLGQEYGVYIHANILNTLLSKNYFMYFSAPLEWFLIFCIVILSLWVNLSASRRILMFGNLAIVVCFWGIIPLGVLLGTNLIFNYPVQIIFSLVLAFTTANIMKYLVEDKNKQKLNKALSEYVGSNIAQEILFEEGKLNLDGEQKNLVYFFSDIEGFTNFSEIFTPAELVSFLREYLTEMTECIMEEGGYIDKFEGDAIMAFWGAFTPLEHTTYLSLCFSALKQQKSIKDLNEKWKQRLQKDLVVRMGLHAGDAIVGNIGAIGKKMDFTALGDNVNLASRLEGVNKYYGSTICTSEVVYLETKQTFFYRFLDIIQVKGKEKPVKIYELLGVHESISLQQKQNIEVFHKAWNLYAAKDFQKAKDMFYTLVLSGDFPSKTYLERCDLFLETPPEADWNGVWRMMEK